MKFSKKNLDKERSYKCNYYGSVFIPQKINNNIIKDLNLLENIGKQAINKLSNINTNIKSATIKLCQKEIYVINNYSGFNKTPLLSSLFKSVIGIVFRTNYIVIMTSNNNMNCIRCDVIKFDNPSNTKGIKIYKKFNKHLIRIFDSFSTLKNTLLINKPVNKNNIFNNDGGYIEVESIN